MRCVQLAFSFFCFSFFFPYIFANFYCLRFEKVVRNTEKPRDLPLKLNVVSESTQRWTSRWNRIHLIRRDRVTPYSGIVVIFQPSTYALVEMSFFVHSPHMQIQTVRFHRSCYLLIDPNPMTTGWIGSQTQVEPIRSHLPDYNWLAQGRPPDSSRHLQPIRHCPRTEVIDV